MMAARAKLPLLDGVAVTPRGARPMDSSDR